MKAWEGNEALLTIVDSVGSLSGTKYVVKE